MNSYFKYIIPLLFSIAVSVSACKKMKKITDSSAKVEFSTDTLTFDTVFTTIGSSTKFFRVFNPHKQWINISQIKIAGGTQSQFRINVDGVPGTDFKDIEIAPEDSLYIFVEVTVDPNADNLPFIISDSVIFVTNGNVQDVKLTAYGQNAHFYNDVIICDETWVNDKPYVILGSVLIDTNCTLTIKEGVRIFVHKGSVNSPTYIYVAGTLKIEGTQDTFVNFEGDRLEHFFDDLPGQWGGIVFLRGSKNNSIKYTRFNEATTALILGSSSSSDLSTFTQFNQPDVTLENVIIKNCQENGIFSFYSKVKATNTLIHSIGKQNLNLLMGGDYEFTHCTIANYGTTGLEHKTPTLRLLNYFITEDKISHVRPVNADFTNSIFYGSIPLDTSKTAGEIFVDSIAVAGLDFNYVFDHCLVKTNLDVTTPNFINTLKNQDPLFEEISEGNYSLKSGSPAINKGNPAANVLIDLFAKPRVGIPDIGAIESD